MRRLLRWIAIVMACLVALVIVAIAVVYGRSEWMLRQTHPVPAVLISIPVDSASIIEGQRLATIRGCFGGCHGRQAGGKLLFDEPMIGRLVAPNLTAAVGKYSDAELAVVIRNGLRPGGRSMFVMPSSTFAGLTEGDLGRIIAFLKSLPAAPGPGQSFSLGPLGRLGVAIGEFKSEAQLIAETVPPPEAAGERAANGRYLARTICATCHGTDLGGTSNPEFTSPNLRIVAAYSAEAFTQLLRTGVALGGRTLRTMSPEAVERLSFLTDAEITDLFSYLHAIPEAARK